MTLVTLLACQPDAPPFVPAHHALAEAIASPVPTGTAPSAGSTPEDAAPQPLVARITADVSAGEFPLTVAFDASGSELGSGRVHHEWSFGDGAAADDDGGAVHTYVGEGAFAVTLTLVDEATGAESHAELAIDVARPGCPTPAPPVAWGNVADAGLVELSGIVASRRDPDASWVHEDSGNAPAITALDRTGAILSTQELPDAFADLEDLAASRDPASGIPLLFLADIGDNGWSREEVAIWVVEEPDPRVDGALSPLRMGLTYPDGPVDAETLLVDPTTLDLYVVTKEAPARVYVKRAPHDAEGPFELEPLGVREAIAFASTGGDVSPDGTRVVIRDYSATAWLWIRDGYAPLEDAFDVAGCPIAIHDEPQGEAIGFTADGAGVETVSEGEGPPVWYIGL